MLRRTLYLAALTLMAAPFLVPSASRAQLPSSGGGSSLGMIMQLLPLVSQFGGDSACPGGSCPTLGGGAMSQFRDAQQALGVGGSAGPVGQSAAGGFSLLPTGAGDLQDKLRFVLQAVQQSGNAGSGPASPGFDLSALQGAGSGHSPPAMSTFGGNAPRAAEPAPAPGPKTIQNPFVKRP